MSRDKIKQMLEKLETIAFLKEIKREGWKISGIESPESVADHSFMMAVLALFLVNESNIDKGKIVQMCIVHDLAECITGDIVWQRGKIEDREIKRKKEELEKEAISKLLSENISSLPPNGIQEIKSLLEEYLSQQTKEAKMVKELDKLEMCFQAYIYQKKHDSFDPTPFYESASKYLKTDSLKQYFFLLKKMSTDSKVDHS